MILSWAEPFSAQVMAKTGQEESVSNTKLVKPKDRFARKYRYRCL